MSRLLSNAPSSSIKYSTNSEEKYENRSNGYLTLYYTLKYLQQFKVSVNLSSYRKKGMIANIPPHPIVQHFTRQELLPFFMMMKNFSYGFWEGLEKKRNFVFNLKKFCYKHCYKH